MSCFLPLPHVNLSGEKEVDSSPQLELYDIQLTDPISPLILSDISRFYIQNILNILLFIVASPTSIIICQSQCPLSFHPGLPHLCPHLSLAAKKNLDKFVRMHFCRMKPGRKSFENSCWEKNKTNEAEAPPINRLQQIQLISSNSKNIFDQTGRRIDRGINAHDFIYKWISDFGCQTLERFGSIFSDR